MLGLFYLWWTLLLRCRWGLAPPPDCLNLAYQHFIFKINFILLDFLHHEALAIWLSLGMRGFEIMGGHVGTYILQPLFMFLVVAALDEL